MCGLVGIAGAVTGDHEKAFKTLLILDSLRGVDSTGIATIPRQGEAKIAKQLGNPYELIEHPSFNRALMGMHRVLIGHNRWATVGGISRRTAHPFQVGEIIGAHNGTLTNKYQLLDSTDFTVDSENLFHHIHKKGLRDAMDVAIGAWSLTWWDEIEESVHFLRNKERPLFYAFDNKGLLWWASESWMLHIASSRHNFTLSKVLETTEDVHYSFIVDGKGVVGEAEVEPMKALREPQVFPGGHQIGGASKVNTIRHQVAAPQPTPQNVSVTPTGKVVVFPLTKSQGDFIQSYVGRKQEQFLVDSVERDEKGAQYCACTDSEFPNLDIRYYVNVKDKPHTLIGRTLIADVGKYYKFGVGYYKLEYSSVRLVPKVLHKDTPKFLDVAGNFLTKEEWEAKHGSCCWCSGPVFACDGRYKFVKGSGNDPLCGDCLKDPEISKYIAV